MNLTPDENTGIGSWSEATFVQAMKSGKHMGVVAADPAADALARPTLTSRTTTSRRSTRFLRTIPPCTTEFRIRPPPASAPGASAGAPPTTKKP
jgi:hypothetical protein